jgi:hypothetical protein
METLFMKRFIHLENLKHFRALLTRTTSEAERKRIIQLIEEEELNYRAAAADQAQSSVAPNSNGTVRRPARQ